MKVLIVTNMYPTPETPSFGVFVHDQVEALRREGVEIDVFFVNGRASTWNYLSGLARLRRYLRDHQYDLIHAHYVFAGVLARAQWGHKVVLTHHGLEVLGYPRWQGWLCRFVTPLMDHTIYVSEHLRRALGDIDGTVIPCGVNLEEITPIPQVEARRQLGLPLDKKLVLWAGEHWRAEKGFPLAEQAVERIKGTLPEAELVLFSKRPHSEVALYMSACDALVLTSVAEGSPMVIKEAMACNLPIVSVPVGDVAAVIAGTDGCAIARRNPDDLATALINVLRRAQRTDGRMRIADLQHDRIARRVLQVYAGTVAHASLQTKGRYEQHEERRDLRHSA